MMSIEKTIEITEHRLYAREPSELTVRLVQQGRVVATVQAIDMSSKGLGIEHPDVALKSGQIVDVDFFKSGYPRGISCCVPAIVVHANSRSAGLMIAYNPHLQMVSPEHRAK